MSWLLIGAEIFVGMLVGGFLLGAMAAVISHALSRPKSDPNIVYYR